MENLRKLLRGLSEGHENVFLTDDGRYIFCRGYVPENAKEMTIESRIQFEIYGEYPLSPDNQIEWDGRVRKAFNFKKSVNEEYKDALKITQAYEDEQKRLYDIKVEAFKKELTEYFENNLIDGLYKLEEFELRDGVIIPEEPCMEENYDGGNDEDIEKICKKHGVNFSIVYWCYHK